MEGLGVGRLRGGGVGGGGWGVGGSRKETPLADWREDPTKEMRSPGTMVAPAPSATCRERLLY